MYGYVSIYGCIGLNVWKICMYECVCCLYVCMMCMYMNVYEFFNVCVYLCKDVSVETLKGCY